MEKERCSENISGEGRFGSFHPHQCHKPVWKDGKCKVHHPDIVKERQDKSMKKYLDQIENSPARRWQKKAEEYRQAAMSSCALARIKYGNLDADVDAELTRIETLCRES